MYDFPQTSELDNEYYLVHLENCVPRCMTSLLTFSNVCSTTIVCDWDALRDRKEGAFFS